MSPSTQKNAGLKLNTGVKAGSFCMPPNSTGLVVCYNTNNDACSCAGGCQDCGGLTMRHRCRTACGMI